MKDMIHIVCVNMINILKGAKFWKFVLTVAIIAGISLGGYFLFDWLGLMSPEGMDNKLEPLGAWLYIIYIAIFVVQAVLLSFVPGNTTAFVLAGFFLFNEDFGVTFLVCGISIILGAVALYCVGRFGGRKLLFWLFGKQAVESRLNWLGEKGTRAVPWLFLIPMMPTDLICLVCGASKMKFWQFMLIVVVFRPIEVVLLISYRYIVPTILEYDPLIVILLINVAIIDFVLLLLYYKTLIKLFKKYTSPITDVFTKNMVHSTGKVVCPNCEPEPIIIDKNPE